VKIDSIYNIFDNFRRTAVSARNADTPSWQWNHRGRLPMPLGAVFCISRRMLRGQWWHRRLQTNSMNNTPARHYDSSYLWPADLHLLPCSYYSEPCLCRPVDNAIYAVYMIHYVTGLRAVGRAGSNAETYDERTRLGVILNKRQLIYMRRR